MSTYFLDIRIENFNDFTRKTQHEKSVPYVHFLKIKIENQFINLKQFSKDPLKTMNQTSNVH